MDSQERSYRKGRSSSRRCMSYGTSPWQKKGTFIFSHREKMNVPFFTPGALRAQQRLDRAALVHCPVTFCDLSERQRQVEDLSGFDLSVQHQVDQLRQVAPDRRGTA